MLDISLFKNILKEIIKRGTCPRTERTHAGIAKKGRLLHPAGQNFQQFQSTVKQGRPDSKGSYEENYYHKNKVHYSLLILCFGIIGVKDE